jgi:hypothetical protein
MELLYKVGLGKIYTEQEIELQKKSLSFASEYDLSFESGIDALFNAQDLEAVFLDRYDSSEEACTIPSMTRWYGIDCGYSTSAFGICIIQWRTLLVIDTANTLISPNTYGFLPLTDQQSGIYLGLPSIALFFAFRRKTQLVASLLIAGGILLAVSKIVEPVMGSNLYLAIALPYLYISLITIGFILTGLGILKVVKRY